MRERRERGKKGERERKGEGEEGDMREQRKEIELVYFRQEMLAKLEFTMFPICQQNQVSLCSSLHIYYVFVWCSWCGMWVSSVICGEL